MTQIKKILFPLSPDVAGKISPTVETMSKAFDSEVHVLFVVRDIKPYKGLPYPSIQYGSYESGSEVRTEQRANMLESLKQFCAGHLGGLDNCVQEVTFGNPAEEILKYIDSANIDLVIMGTHGRRGLEEIFFGSVAREVIGKSKVPVTVVNPYLV